MNLKCHAGYGENLAFLVMLQGVFVLKYFFRSSSSTLFRSIRSVSSLKTITDVGVCSNNMLWCFRWHWTLHGLTKFVSLFSFHDRPTYITYLSSPDLPLNIFLFGNNLKTIWDNFLSEMVDVPDVASSNFPFRALNVILPSVVSQTVEHNLQQ